MITDDPSRAGFCRYRDIHLCAIGEDGDTIVALGHHDPRHALSAMNAYVRGLLGWTDLTDGDGTHLPGRWKQELAKLETTWAIQKYACDEAGDDGHDPDCAECPEIENAGWWLEWDIKPDREGAFPVMIWNA